MSRRGFRADCGAQTLEPTMTGLRLLIIAASAAAALAVGLSAHARISAAPQNTTVERAF